MSNNNKMRTKALTVIETVLQRGTIQTQYYLSHRPFFQRPRTRKRATITYRSDKRIIMYNHIILHSIFARETRWNFIPTTSCHRYHNILLPAPRILLLWYYDLNTAVKPTSNNSRGRSVIIILYCIEIL